MPGQARKLVGEIYRCPVCSKNLATLDGGFRDAVDECACGFTSQIEDLRRRPPIPAYHFPAIRPAGVWLLDEGSAWAITVLPLSVHAGFSWLTMVASAIFVLSILFRQFSVTLAGDPLKTGFWIALAIITGYPALAIASIRCDGLRATLVTGAWRFFSPTRIDWTQLHAIRLHVYLYSDGSEARSIMLEADEAVEFGRNLGEEQVEYVFWTLLRRALEPKLSSPPA